jgi:hypothetical protein
MQYLEFLTVFTCLFFIVVVIELFRGEGKYFFNEIGSACQFSSNGVKFFVEESGKAVEYFVEIVSFVFVYLLKEIIVGLIIKNIATFFAVGFVFASCYNWTEVKDIAKEVFVPLKEGTVALWDSIKHPTNVIKYAVGIMILYIPFAMQRLDFKEKA